MTQMHTSLHIVCGHFNFDSHVLYFCLVLDPVYKLDYINAAWEEKYLEIGMKQFKSQVTFLIAPHRRDSWADIFFSFLFIRQNMNLWIKKACQLYYWQRQQVSYSLILFTRKLTSFLYRFVVNICMDGVCDQKKSRKRRVTRHHELFQRIQICSKSWTGILGNQDWGERNVQILLRIGE